MAAVVCHHPIQSKNDKDEVPVEESKLGKESDALRIDIPELDKETGAPDCEGIQEDAEETGLRAGT